MINSLVPIKPWDNSSAAPSSDYNCNYELLGKWTILSVRRYFKVTKKRYAIEDTKMLVWCIDNRTISTYRDIEIFGQCFHIDGCLSIEWDDTPDHTIYRPSIIWSFDIRYIEVSRYHKVSISNLSSIEPALMPTQWSSRRTSSHKSCRY